MTRISGRNYSATFTGAPSDEQVAALESVVSAVHDRMREDVTPRRIQRQRTKGWRMPAGAVYVGRPTRWGNPYTPAEHGASALDLYAEHLDAEIAGERLDLEELRGRDLACWCAIGAPCHADVLLRRANRKGGEP